MASEMVNGGALDDQYRSVFRDASRIVDVARSTAVRSVNAAMTAAYWMIGQRIVEFEQSGRSGLHTAPRSSPDSRRICRNGSVAVFHVRTFSRCANSTSLFGWIRFARHRLANLSAPP